MFQNTFYKGKYIMDDILIYSDSLTWGIIPDSRKRLPFDKRCTGFTRELKLVAKEYSCYFFDANEVTDASAVDGIHLDEKKHNILGKKIANIVSDYETF